MNILAIIPARGGSKGIKRKNIRLLNGKPLIWYAINNAKNVHLITDILVTTDDDDIAEYVMSQDVPVRIRPKKLARDDVPLDPVIIDAYDWYSKKTGKEFDYIVTLQPTSPLLSSITLENAISMAIQGDYDSIISVIDDTHLMWKKEKNGSIVPIYKNRVNRQWLPQILKETGAFVISRNQLFRKGKRIGGNIGLYEVPLDESIDIDSPIDWFMAESILKRKRVKIAFVVKGNRSVGMGHVYRSMALGDLLLGHDVSFLLIDSDDKSFNVVKEHFPDVRGVSSYTDVIGMIREKGIDLVINDILDTPRAYIENLRSDGVFVVNFEDLGEGSNYANLVINALYEKIDAPSNHKYGYKYVVLREDFLITSPNVFSENVRSVLITFGGVDQNNLTIRALRALQSLRKKSLITEANIKIVVGPSYKYLDHLKYFLENSCLNAELFVNVKNMAKLMKNTDLAITSNGRTVFELASMRVPMISIAQNDRETLHTFARYNEGVRYLGVACNVSENIIEDALEEIIKKTDIRKKMFDSLPYQEIREGVLRVKNLIFEEYWRWREDEDKNREEIY